MLAPNITIWICEMLSMANLTFNIPKSGAGGKYSGICLDFFVWKFLADTSFPSEYLVSEMHYITWVKWVENATSC